MDLIFLSLRFLFHALFDEIWSFYCWKKSIVLANLIIFQKSLFSLKNMVLLYLLICSSIVYCAWFRPTKTSDKNPTCVSADLAFVAVDQ